MVGMTEMETIAQAKRDLTESEQTQFRVAIHQSTQGTPQSR
jgi:hypothetical protein